MFKRLTSFLICLCFIISNLTLSQAQGPAADGFVLPPPGKMVSLSGPFNPAVLKGIKVHDDNPFIFDFILDKGDVETPLMASLRNESTKLIKYFLASITIPENDLWVNLSPYEKDRIIPQSFGLTQMGRDLLAEDYMLKQITASLIYPEGAVGKKFWARVYAQATKRFGTTNVPVDTFNKVWIVPDKALVYENVKAHTAYVLEAKLKVMLEEDYLSLSKHVSLLVPRNDTSKLGSQIIREIVIPELTKEINFDKNFSPLRQIYNSLILATWYKKKIKDSVFSQVYANKSKVAGINISDAGAKQKIFEQYLKAFKKGVYNYIKEERDITSKQIVPRKYFSGGAKMGDVAAILQETTDAAMLTRREFLQGMAKGAAALGLLEVTAGCGAGETPPGGTPINRGSLTKESVLSAFEKPKDAKGAYKDDKRGYYIDDQGFPLDDPLSKDEVSRLQKMADKLIASSDPQMQQQGRDLQKTIDRQVNFTSTENMALLIMARLQLNIGDETASSLIKSYALSGTKTFASVNADTGTAIRDFIQLLGNTPNDMVSGISSTLMGWAILKSGDEYLRSVEHIAKFVINLQGQDGRIADVLGGDTKTPAYSLAAYLFLRKLDRRVIPGNPKNTKYGLAADEIYAWLKTWLKDPMADLSDPRIMLYMPIEELADDPNFQVSSNGATLSGLEAVDMVFKNLIGSPDKPKLGIFDKNGLLIGIGPSPELAQWKTKDGELNPIYDSISGLIAARLSHMNNLVKSKGKTNYQYLDYGGYSASLKDENKRHFIPDGTGNFVGRKAEYLNKNPITDEDRNRNPLLASLPRGDVSLEAATYAVFALTDTDPFSMDHAMMTRSQHVHDKTQAAPDKNLGGIDLTAENMNLQTTTVGRGAKGGIKFHLDPAMLAQLQKSPGFQPVIINIQPLKNLEKFLGVT